MRTTPQDTVRCRFFAPVEQAYKVVASRRQCPEFSDEDFIEAGVGRVIADVQSGRDWVQQLRMWMNSRLSVGNLFQSLRSARRLRHLQDVAAHVCQQVDEGVPPTLDPLVRHAELNEFHVYASDGHYEQPSTHASNPQKETQAVGSFYSINLRSHSLSLLDIARPVRKREHDITALKRLGSTVLRMGAAKGTKVIHVYDPAAVDYAQWHRWKAKGVYIISREKENSKALVTGHNPWDRKDPRNAGVQADDLVGVFCGVILRRVRYHDPVTDTVYSYMTSEMTLPPGLIAFLYKLRWDVEKVFDEKKNKLREKKAWASQPVAHCQQALFICMAHNMMLLFERCLESQDGICDQKVQVKRQVRLANMQAEAKQKGYVINSLVVECTRMTQRSLQFIRWLRYCLQAQTSYVEGLAVLRPLMKEYLA